LEHDRAEIESLNATMQPYEVEVERMQRVFRQAGEQGIVIPGLSAYDQQILEPPHGID
jgi:hypothetical protein